MPIIKSAIKRAKQAVIRRERNIATKKDIKSAVKAFLAKPTAAGLSAAQSEIDTAVKKNILDKRTAARRKSSLSKVAKQAGIKLVAQTKAAPKATATAKAPAKKPAAKKATSNQKTTAKPAVKKPAAKA